MDAIITAFASGKGGTGKSTVSALVGAALAARGSKVVLVEMAPSLRSMDVITGVTELAVFDLEDVLSGYSSPSKAVVRSPLYPGLSVIPAPYSGGQIIPESMELLCARFRPHFEHILLDVSSGLGSAFMAAADVAHRFIMVETPDPVALRDGRLLVDTLDDMPIQMKLLLNRVNPARVLASSAIEDLDEAIDTVGLQLLGVIPESEAIQRSGECGVALAANSTEGHVFDAIARRILGEDVPLIIS